MLDGIERVGNKMPAPAILFLWLCLGVILYASGSMPRRGMSGGCGCQAPAAAPNGS